MPTVERIKWTSNRIIAISRSSNTTFDTHKLYLRTDPAGILKIGGYQPTPGIWGIASNILNHDDMWFPAAIFGTLTAYYGSYSPSSSLASNTWWNITPLSQWGKIYVPKNTVAKIVVCPVDSYRHPVDYNSTQVESCYGPLQYVQVNGKDTSTQFRWVARIRTGIVINYGTGQGTTLTTAYIAPFLYNATFLPEIKSTNGYYRFPAPPGGNFSYAYEAMGEYLIRPSDGAQLKNCVVSSGSVSPIININPWALFTKLNPVTLSVGLTV